MINKERISNLLYDILSSANFIVNEHNHERKYEELKEIRGCIKEIFEELDKEDKQR